MDVRERGEDRVSNAEVLQALAARVRSEIYTAVPVKVTEDSDGHTASLQPLIKGVRRMPDGTSKTYDFPLIPKAPVNHASGGGMTVSIPIRKDDIGFALVMCRSVDAYQQQGGVQQQVDVRTHDLSDAIFIPGLKPDPQKLTKYDKESVQIRSNDGKHMVAMHPTKGPLLSADDGKHMVGVNPQTGISVKTAMKLAIDATGGLDVKGVAHFADAVTSATSFGAPTLNGQTGGGFTGIMNGFIGALIGAGLMFYATTPPEPVEPLHASYRAAAR